jgi:lysophospholipase L1-like esterase
MPSPGIIKSELGWSALMISILISLSNCTQGSQCNEVDALPDSVAIATLGDSLFNFNWETCRQVSGALSLMFGEEVSDHSVYAARLTGPIILDVYNQYDYANQSMPELASVVFQGGGNDIHCECTVEERPECYEDVERLLDETGQLIDQMAADGRDTIIYVGYYPLAGSFAHDWPAIDSMMNQMDPLCADKGCIFLDLRPVFAGHPEWILGDGRHPSPEGSHAIASEIYDVLLGQCNCDMWQDGLCGGGACEADTREQTRSCIPPGCLLESQCVPDAACEECNCDVWQDGECGGGSCAADTREQTRSCIPPGCLLESQCVPDPTC